jgi:copper chaperone NosL
MDRRYGGELVTRKGKVYKFDDVNCMLYFFNSEEVKHSDFAHKLVVDFSRPATLVQAADAFYLKSPGIKSPMASGIAAFQKRESMQNTKKELKGIYLVWGEVVTQFK